MSEILDEGINNTINTITENTQLTVKGLEETVADILQSSELLSVRPQIVEAYRQYAEVASQELNNLRIVSEPVLITAPGSNVETPVDTQVIDTLIEDSKGTFRQNFLNHAETVATIAVTAAVVGAVTGDTVFSARKSISGVFATSSDPQIIRRQNRLRTLLLDPNHDRAVARTLRGEITDLMGGGTAGSLRDSIIGSSENTVMRFAGALLTNRSKREGVNRFRYAGGVIDTTRPWCADLEGTTLTEEEMYDLWSEDWAGKSGSDPFLDRGGYNCRHYWEPVEDDSEN